MPCSSYDRRWIARWIAGSTLAQVLGGSVGVALTWSAHQAGVAGDFVLAAIAVGVLAGLLAGGLVGAVEAALLPRGVSRRPWIQGTTVGAVIVWLLIAVTPVLLVSDPGAPAKPLIARFALAMCVGASAGMLLAAFQTPALEVLSVRPRPWLLGNGAAWGAATPFTYTVTGVPSSTESVAVSALVLFVVAGLIGGATTTVTFLLEERRAQLIGQSTGRTCATELV